MASVHFFSFKNHSTLLCTYTVSVDISLHPTVHKYSKCRYITPPYCATKNSASSWNISHTSVVPPTRIFAPWTPNNVLTSLSYCFYYLGINLLGSISFWKAIPYLQNLNSAIAMLCAMAVTFYSYWVISIEWIFTKKKCWIKKWGFTRQHPELHYSIG